MYASVMAQKTPKVNMVHYLPVESTPKGLVGYVTITVEIDRGDSWDTINLMLPERMMLEVLAQFDSHYRGLADTLNGRQAPDIQPEG